MSVHVNDAVAAVGRSIGIDLRAAILADLEGRAGLDSGLIELNIGDGISRAVGEWRPEAAVAHELERAPAFDSPPAGTGGGSVEIIGVGQNERAGAELPVRVRPCEG